MTSDRRRTAMSDWYLLTRTSLFIIKRLYRQTTDELGPHLEGAVVDVGCGSDVYRTSFTNATSYVGIDMAVARRPAIVADAQSLPLAEASFDGAVCMEVLEHVVDPDAVMTEIRRVLRPGGMLYVTVPMSWNHHYAPHDYRRYTCYGLWQILRRHGFEVVETRRIGGLYSMVGSRLVDGIASELRARLHVLPPRVRHAAVLCYSIPSSLTFWVIARAGDRFQSPDLRNADALGWAAVARRSG